LGLPELRDSFESDQSLEEDASSASYEFSNPREAVYEASKLSETNKQIPEIDRRLKMLSKLLETPKFKIQKHLLLSSSQLSNPQ